MVGGGVALVGMSMLKIYASCFNDAVCCLFIFVSGVVGVWLRRAWVRSFSACVSVSTDGILGKSKISGMY